MRPKIIHVLLILCCVVAGAQAQINVTQWQQIGPVGGDINEIIETDSGDLIAGTRLGGLYRSADKGANWTLIPVAAGAPLLFTSVWDLVKNAQGHLFAATNRGVYRSTDNGTSWTLFDAGFTNRFVEALAINSIDVIFAATRAGVFRSEDNGETWTEFNNGLTDTFVMAIAINSLGDVFAGTTSGVFFSDDNGDNWTARNTGFPTNPGIIKLFVTPDDALYAGTFNGGYRSADHGMNWQQVLNIGTTISFARNSNNLLVAGPAGSRIARSTDNGVNWTTADGFQDVAGYNDLYFLSDTDLLAATFRYGMLHTSDGGDSWSELNNGIVATEIQALAQTQGGDILAGTGTGPFKSTDGGDTWTFAGSSEFKGPTRFIAINGTGRVFAEIGSLLVTSDDGGGSWTQADASYSGSRPESIAFADNNVVYVGAYGQAFISTDNGDTWTEISNGLPPDADVGALGVSADGTVFAGVEDTGVYRSTTMGATWVETSTGLPVNYDPAAFVLQPSGDMLVGGFGGVFRTSDNGDNWETTSNPIFGIQAFIQASNGDLYVGGRGEGIVVSEDGGSSWVRIDDELVHLDVTSLLAENANTLHAGTRGGGVFKAELVHTNVEPDAEGLPNTFTLEQNYPNPFNPTTIINYRVPAAGHVALKIFNTLGQEVRTLANSDHVIGTHQAVWDGRDSRHTIVPSGVYFYQLKAGSFMETRTMLLIR